MAATRRPWGAVLWSLASPGIGHLYNGRPFAAAALLLGMPLTGIAFAWLMTQLSWAPWNVVVPVLVLVGLQIAVAVHAGVDAVRLRDAPRPWYGRWYACLLVWILNAALLVPTLTYAVVRLPLVQAFLIPTGGMEPTILIGDHLLADKMAYGIFGTPRLPSRGDVIIFRFPEEPSRLFIKRVIGLPGDRVEIRQTTVYVNGQPLAEPYAAFASERASGRKEHPVEQVPPGHLYVLGDNRDNSRDSRFWGFLPLENLVAQATIVYFSREQDRQGNGKAIRWGRIGHRIR